MAQQTGCRFVYCVCGPLGKAFTKFIEKMFRTKKCRRQSRQGPVEGHHAKMTRTDTNISQQLTRAISRNEYSTGTVI